MNDRDGFLYRRLEADYTRVQSIGRVGLDSAESYIRNGHRRDKIEARNVIWPSLEGISHELAPTQPDQLGIAS